MTGTNQNKTSTRQLLLDNGLDMGGSFSESLIWEYPAKIHERVHATQVEIGAYSYIAPGTELHSVTLGRFCSIGPNIRLFGSAHPTQWLSSHPFTHVNIFNRFVEGTPPRTFEGYPKRTEIGHDVWMGTDVIVIPGVKIGNGAIIGAGAVVAKDVPDYAVVVGNPGRVVKYRFDEALIERFKRVQWWRYDLPRSLKSMPDLPVDDPVAALDRIEENPDAFLPLKPERRQLFTTREGTMVRKLPPLEI
ncbi:CatB-related O-acetyltransferase [Microvirga flavescens]|uniref:CatB-related O-acetyltransferase n=1 Tax=Microvirga flavescens TaxID=2249811 RepID=UPI000DDAE00D|nr:CatB-related O-acetyltransferase [Microvirga flavescens]